MPSWLMGLSNSTLTIAGGLTRYSPVAGRLGGANSNSADYVSVRARDSYTWGNLFVRVTANTTGNASTITGYKGVGTALTVTIPAGTTGTFQDVVNTVALVTGDTFCWRQVIGAGGSITISVITCTLTTLANTTPIEVSSSPESNVTIYSYLVDTYLPILGELAENSAEVNSGIIIRTNTTFSNMHIVVTTNNLSTTTDVRFRVNLANGNQLIQIPGGTTGRFEDAVNTDVVASGSKVDYRITPGADGVDFITTKIMHVMATGASRFIGASLITGASFGFGTTNYFVIEGSLTDNLAAEANSQSLAMVPFSIQNEYVRVSSNSCDGQTTVRLRKNSANGNLVVTIPAGLTGDFEDLINIDNFVAADSLDWEIAVGGTAGSVIFRSVKGELQQGGGGPTNPKASNIASKLIAANVI